MQLLLAIFMLLGILAILAVGVTISLIVCWKLIQKLS